jgi:hypothetical protein
MNSGSGKMGATPHTTNDSLAWLRGRFKDRLISRKCGFKILICIIFTYIIGDFIYKY